MMAIEGLPGTVTFCPEAPIMELTFTDDTRNVRI